MLLNGGEERIHIQVDDLAHAVLALLHQGRAPPSVQRSRGQPIPLSGLAKILSQRGSQLVIWQIFTGTVLFCHDEHVFVKGILTPHKKAKVLEQRKGTFLHSSEYWVQYKTASGPAAGSKTKNAGATPRRF